MNDDDTRSTHQCAGDHLGDALVETWSRNITDPLLHSFFDHLHEAMEADLKCGCGNQFCSDAVHSATYTVIASLIYDMAGDDLATAMLIAGRVIERMGQIAGPPQEVESAGRDDADHQTAPSTITLN